MTEIIFDIIYKPNLYTHKKDNAMVSTREGRLFG